MAFLALTWLRPPEILAPGVASFKGGRSVDRADDVQHSLMLRLLFYTGVRVSELCRMEVGAVDLEACKIRIE
ncbi:MAG: tyrosine-type recombinase/integrase, partial [Planctomycetia bacterium]